MDYLDHFSVPYLGINLGHHTYQFEVDLPFFKEFDNDQVLGANVAVDLDLDKRPDMAEAIFHINGMLNLTCNRCLQEMQYPLNLDQRIHIKYGEEVMDEDEVMYIKEDTAIVNFAQVIYEYICLNLPMVPAHEDEADCDPKVIERLHNNTEEEGGNDIWGSLKDIKFN